MLFLSIVFKMSPESIFLCFLRPQLISWSGKNSKSEAGRSKEKQFGSIIREEQPHGSFAKWIQSAGSLDGKYRHRIQHPVKEAGLVHTLSHEHGEV